MQLNSSSNGSESHLEMIHATPNWKEIALARGLNLNKASESGIGKRCYTLDQGFRDSQGSSLAKQRNTALIADTSISRNHLECETVNRGDWTRDGKPCEGGLEEGSSFRNA